MKEMKIIKRSGEEVAFDKEKITHKQANTEIIDNNLFFMMPLLTY